MCISLLILNCKRKPERHCSNRGGFATRVHENIITIFQTAILQSRAVSHMLSELCHASVPLPNKTVGPPRRSFSHWNCLTGTRSTSRLLIFSTEYNLNEVHSTGITAPFGNIQSPSLEVVACIHFLCGHILRRCYTEITCKHLGQIFTYRRASKVRVLSLLQKTGRKDV